MERFSLSESQVMLSPQQQSRLIDRMNGVELPERLTPETNKMWQVKNQCLPLISKMVIHGHKPSLSALIELERGLYPEQPEDTWSDDLEGWLRDAGLSGVKKADVVRLDTINEFDENEEIQKFLSSASPLEQYIYADINPTAIGVYLYDICSLDMKMRLWLMDEVVIEGLVDSGRLALEELPFAAKSFLFAIVPCPVTLIEGLAGDY